MNKLFTQCKRELWECRASLIRTPMILSLLLMVLLLLGIVPLQNRIGAAVEQAAGEHAVPKVPAELFSGFGGQAFSTAPEYLVHGLATVYALFVVVLLLVVAFYLVDTLYSDRRDQSILFWKSMPVSEHHNVLNKLFTGLVTAPALYAGGAVVTGAFFLLVFMVYATFFWSLPVPGVGAVVWALLTSSVGLVLGWFALVLWLLPVFCWLLFSSAVARKTPFLIALGVPLGLMLLEAWVLGSAHLFSLVKTPTISALIAFQTIVHSPSAIAGHIGGLLTAPSFWWGLAASLLFIVGAIWLRIRRWEL